MRPRSQVLLVVLSIVSARGAAQVDSTRMREVLATEDQRFAAMRRGDTAALQLLLAPDLTYTHTDGAQNTKAELLRILSSGALRYDSIVPEARDVRVLASTAVVTGRSAMRVESGGHVAAFRIRYLAVYRRGPRVWQLTAWQSTRLLTDKVNR
ncbi:MAG TPA: nuclear transport factor 2 family protein [Gemmatimonadales bacterium]|nr:nuclear transport factor 2 family protein [Gemmatimonadales bacterium]